MSTDAECVARIRRLALEDTLPVSTEANAVDDVTGRRAAWYAPAIAAAFASQDERWSWAVGSAEGQVPAPLDDAVLFRADGLTITFVILHALFLIERGLLSSAMALRDVLPEGAVAVLFDDDRATLSHLLSLPYPTLLTAGIREIRHKPMPHAHIVLPAVVSTVIESVVGPSWHIRLTDDLLKPLGMMQSGWSLPGKKRHVCGHNPGGERVHTSEESAEILLDQERGTFLLDIHPSAGREALEALLLDPASRAVTGADAGTIQAILDDYLAAVPDRDFWRYPYQAIVPGFWTCALDMGSFLFKLGRNQRSTLEAPLRHALAAMFAYEGPRAGPLGWCKGWITEVNGDALTYTGGGECGGFTHFMAMDSRQNKGAAILVNSGACSELCLKMISQFTEAGSAAIPLVYFPHRCIEDHGRVVRPSATDPVEPNLEFVECSQYLGTYARNDAKSRHFDLGEIRIRESGGHLLARCASLGMEVNCVRITPAVFDSPIGVFDFREFYEERPVLRVGLAAEYRRRQKG